MADVAKVDDFARRLDIIVMTPPAPNSPADRARASRLDGYAFDQAATALRAAIDHLQAWRALLAAGYMPAYAHFSLLRTVHESALFAYWLTEPSCSAEDRRARGVAAQAADFEERRKLEESIGRTEVTPPAKLAIDRLKDLMLEATNAGLTTANRKGQEVLSVPVPATVELFDRYEQVGEGVRAQFIYRLYSGYAHAKQWALTLGAKQQAPFDESGRSLALVDGSEATALAATRRAIGIIGCALLAFEDLRRASS
ncbi:hypothetical protein [Micromonospora sp. 4G55]|uniref:hypothetical protein n=1 Tax=Micromonospora sp. 4G55 TaxID=2806102 RepID=UPI001A5026F7|nr:hypothetical protein [Micromonospora sp. 4G55]MBM0256483.1 hypothetical protein [Micromonospora sp. 4G55]